MHNVTPGATSPCRRLISARTMHVSVSGEAEYGVRSQCMMLVAACAVIVGRLGMHQLGAVGLSNMVFFFVTVFFSFLLVVTTPRVADALAVDDRARVHFCPML